MMFSRILFQTPPPPRKGMKAQEKAGVGEEPGRWGGWRASAEGPGAAPGFWVRCSLA